MPCRHAATGFDSSLLGWAAEYVPVGPSSPGYQSSSLVRGGVSWNAIGTGRVPRQLYLPVHLLGLAPLLGCIGAVAGDVKLQDDGVMDHPVDCRGGGHGVGEDAFPLREDPPSAAVGGGTHPGLAVQVPGDTGALRQEAIQLPGSAPTGMCPLSGTAVNGASLI